MLTRICKGLICLLIALSLVIQSVSAQVQKNNRQNKLDEKRENERVHQAEKELAEARKQLANQQNALRAALKKLGEAEEKLTDSKQSLSEAKEKVEIALGQSIGLPQAITEFQEQRKVYLELSKPILEQLHARPEWQALESQVAQAKAEKEVLRENIELEDAERVEKIHLLNRILDRPLEVENKALSANAECKAAQTELDKATARVLDLRKKIAQEEIESHPLVNTAQRSVQTNESLVESEEKEVASARSAAVNLQRKVIQAQTVLSKTRAADAKDPNKNNKNNKNSKNNGNRRVAP